MMTDDKNGFPRIILLDDDAWTLAFSEEVIKNFSPHAEIIAFSAAKEAMAYLETDDFMAKRGDTVFLTDLHMPETTGFEVLDRIETRFGAWRNWFHVFVLSAGASSEEIHRVTYYRCVVGFIYKPLTREKFEQILNCIEYPL